MLQICLSTDKYFFYAKLNNKFNRYFRKTSIFRIETFQRSFMNILALHINRAFVSDSIYIKIFITIQISLNGGG